MAKPVLKIEHLDGRVEVSLTDGHGGAPVSGKLVLSKPSEYDSLSEAELRAMLPAVGMTDVSDAKPAKPVKAKRKRKR